MVKVELKFVGVLKITEKERQDINSKMRVFSQDRELEKEFGIKPDSTLYHFEVKFNNGFRADINLNSGQTNCWLEVVLYDKDGTEVNSKLLEDYLYYSDGTDAMSGGDDIIINYEYGDCKFHEHSKYRIVISPKSEQDVLDFKKYLGETLSDFDYKQYADYTKESIAIVGDMKEIEKAKKLLAKADIDVVVNDSVEYEWCMSILKNQFDSKGVFKSRDELEKIAKEVIDDNHIWNEFDTKLGEWIDNYIEGEAINEVKEGLFRKKIELNK